LRAEATIKTVWKQIRLNPLWKQKIMSWKLNISTQSSRASSGTIYTWEHTSAQRDTSLLLLWRKYDGQEQSVSSSGTLRTGTKTSPSRTRKFSPLRSSITTSTTRFMLKHPLKCVLRVQEAITLPTSWFGGRVSHQGVTPLHFCEKGVKTGAQVYQEDVLRVVKPLDCLQWSEMGLPAGLSSCPQGRDNSLLAVEECAGLYQRLGLALRESRPQPTIL
jgi:hypothetical protein